MRNLPTRQPCRHLSCTDQTTSPMLPPLTLPTPSTTIRTNVQAGDCTQLLPEYLRTNAGKIEKTKLAQASPKTGKWDHAIRYATDTTVRPMRPVSDTRKRVLATTMVSLQLRERTTSQPALPAPWDTAVQPPHSPHPSFAGVPDDEKMRHRAASRTIYNSAARAAHFTYKNLDFS